MNEALVLELMPPPNPTEAFLRLIDKPHCLFLDSSRRDRQLGRYSFLAADPYQWIEATAAGRNRLGELDAHLAQCVSAPVSGLPPFQGGAAGLASYDLGRWLERLPAPRVDEFQTLALAMGLYDVAVAFDLLLNRAWIISHGWPEQDDGRRRHKAEERMQQMRRWLSAPREDRAGQPERGAAALCLEQLAPQYPVGDVPGLTSNFAPDAYRRAVQRVIDYIHAGDVFQVNLSQRLLYPAHDRRRQASICGCASVIRPRSAAISTWAISRSPAPRRSGSCK